MSVKLFYVRASSGLFACKDASGAPLGMTNPGPGAHPAQYRAAVARELVALLRRQRITAELVPVQAGEGKDTTA